MDDYDRMGELLSPEKTILQVGVDTLIFYFYSKTNINYVQGRKCTIHVLAFIPLKCKQDVLNWKIVYLSV